nr:hypothetical protein [Prevotella sp.]
ENLEQTKEYVVYIYGMNGSNGELYEIAFLAPPAGPTISASPTSITLAATESGVAVSSSFTIIGSNLTAGTYNLTVPSVTGLTVSPTSFSVAADGSVSQVVSVSYSSTENVSENSVNITATVGEVSMSVPVKYSASVNTWTLQSISTSKTWDFSNLTINKSSTCYNEKDDAIKLDNTTSPTNSDEYVYANYDGKHFTIGSAFDGTSIAFTGQYPIRRNSFAQNGTLKFNTSVPGKIKVKFSDTGSSASSTAVKRYLVINGEATEYWTSRQNNGEGTAYDAQLNVVSGDIPVGVGDVTITGSSAITISYVIFTAMPASVSGTVTASGYNTYSSNYPVDLSTINGGIAYVATSVTDGKVVLAKCTDKVPSSTGLFIAGTAGETFTISTTSETTAAPAANLLVGMPNGGTVNKVADGEYNYVFGWSEVTNPGFYLINATAAELGDFKAYLHTTSALTASAAARLSLSFGDDTTGIDEAVSEATAGGRFFDLQGRSVAQPTKGLYIVNGKKVIIK